MTASASSEPSSTQDRVNALNPFDFHQRTRLIFGCGAIEQLASLASEQQARRVLLVTDAGLRKAGHSERVISILNSAGISSVMFDDVSENPTTDDVDRCVAFARPSNVDLIVGLGGGSSMDCAKGANFLLTNGGRMHDYRGVGKATLPMLPMIAIPTTSGTGSEAQSFAVIADAKSHMKMACGDHKAACKVAILDPELTVTMPRSVTAATGIDAMTHAIESFVTIKRSTISQMFARQAWALLANAFPVVLQEPTNLEARGRMQLGAFFAGAAIENSMLGAAHAAANPLTAEFGVAHGVAVGLMMPHVIRWNSEVVAPLYQDLVHTAGWANDATTADSAAGQLADGLTELLHLAGMPVSIMQATNRPAAEKVLQGMASDAVLQWTGTFNPRKMDLAGFLELYRNAM